MPASDARNLLPDFSVNDVPWPVIIHRPKDGTIVNFNSPARKLFGLSSAQSKDIKLKSLRVASPKSKSVKRNGLTDLGQVLHRTRDGNELLLRVFRKRIRLEGNEYYVDFLEKTKSENTFKENSIHHSSEAIICTNKQGLIIEWNKAAEKTFGWKRKETIDKKNITFLFPEPLTRSCLKELTSSQKLVEITAIHKNKHEFPLEMSITSPLEEGDERLYYLLRNISERKRAAHELTQSEFYLKRAQAIASIGSWEMSGRFQDTYWSDEFYRIHGLEPQSVKPSTRLRLSMVYVKDRAKLEHAIDAAFQESKPYSIEIRIILPNKEIRWVLSQGEVSIDPFTEKKKVFGTVLDITSRKLAEEEQLRIKKRLQQTLLFSRMGTAELTIATEILHIDEELFILLEEEDSQAREVPLHSFLKTYVMPEDIPRIETVIKEGSEAARISESDLLLEFRMRTAKGNILHIDAQGTFRRDGTAFGILRDISLRRKAEAESKSKSTLIETMVHGITDGFFATDRELNFTLVNPVFASSAKLSSNQIIGKNLLEVFPWLRGTKLIAAYHEAIRSGKSSTEEAPGNGHPAQIYQVDIYPNAQGLFVSYKDVSEAKRIEKEIWLSRNSLSNLIENLPGYVYRIKNDKAFTPLFLSRQVEQVVGYSLEEYQSIRQTFHKEIHSSDIERVRQLIAQATAKKESYSCEYRITTKQGEEKWVLEKGKGIYNTDNELIELEGFVTDITDRKKAEQLAKQLKENDERLLSIIKNIPHGVVYQYTVSDNGKNLGFTSVSESAYELFAFTPEYMKSNPDCLNELILPEDRVAMRVQSDLSRSQLAMFEFEYRIINKANVPKWLHTRAYPRREDSGCIIWDAITLDITERKQMEETVRENEQRFRALIRDINIGVLLQGPHTEIFLSNQAGLDLLGVTEDQLLGKTAYHKSWNMIREDGSPIPNEELPVPQAIKTKFPVRGVVMGTYRPLKKDTVWLIVDAIPRVDHEGNIINVICTFSDITKQKLQQEELFQSKNYFEALVNSQSSYLIRIDMNGKYTFINKKFNEQYGNKSGLIGTSSIDAVLAADYDSYNETIAACIRQPGKVVPVTIRQIKKNGSFSWTEWEFVALQNNRGEVTGLQAVGLDATDRINSQIELQKTTSRFAMARQAANLGVWEWDLREQKLISDDIAYEMLGFDKNDSITTAALSRALFPEDRIELRKRLSELTPSKNIMNAIFRITRPSDNQIRHIRFYSIAEFDTKGKTIKITGVNYDNTDQEIAIESIRESEKRFRSLADSAPVLIWMSDTNMKYSYVNKGWLNFTGRQLEEELGNGWGSSIHPDDYIRCMNSFSENFDLQKPIEVEYRLRRKDGLYRWVLDNGNPRFLENGEFIGYIGTCFDIHERKIAEEKLVKSERRFNAFMKNTPVINWITDNKGKMTYVNESYNALLDAQSDDLLGKSVYDIFPVAKTFLENIKTVTETGEVLQTVELAPRNDKTMGEFLVYKFLMGDNQIGGVAADITKQRQAERELVKSLEEKDLLIKEIHHRVKNNLQLISSILYLKMMNMQQSEIKNFLEDTRQKIRSIALIHERLLQTGSVNEVDIADYLGKLLLDLQMSNKRHDIFIHFEYHIEPEKIGLDAAIYCGLIINELVINSIKHAFIRKERGTIKVFFHPVHERHRLIISDDGLSLPENIIPGKSGSFGMQMLNVFIKQLNGQLTIERTHGTTFTIIF
jgi:PAS domain S-box-containing protein